MSFPRYPKYKDSGVEWLGEVPEHWETIPLSRAAAGSDSLFIDGDWIESKDLSDDGIRYLTSGNVGEGYYKEQGQGYISEETFTALNCIEVLPGDVLISRLNLPIGRSCLVPGLGGRIVTCVDNVIVRPDPNFDRRFFVYQLSSKSHFANMENLARGTTMQRISRSTLGRVRFAFPPFPEQTEIAAFLDRETAKIDELVAKQRRLMELLKEKRQAVISHAVTQGLNPHAPMKPSGIEWLGDVPKAWIVKKLGRAVFMQEGPGLRTWQFSDEGTRVICVTNITEAGIDFSRLEKYISTEEYNSSYRHFTVRPGDVLLSSSGNSWGKVAIYHGKEEVILNTSTIRLNETGGAPLKRDYIAMLLQSDAVREQLGLAMTGSCQPNFGPTHLNSVMVVIPSHDEQAAIVTYLKMETSKLGTLTVEAQRTIDLLQERRTALISAAVTGQIDVRRLAGVGRNSVDESRSA